MSDVFIDENNGNDRTGDGTKENPFASIEKAKQIKGDNEDSLIHLRRETRRGSMWSAVEE